MAILTVFRHRFYKNDGTVNSGGKVYTYAAGTTTPTPTYTDSGAGTANANPIILDSKGEADIWVSGLIKVNVLESDDTQVTGWPVDNIGAASGVSTTANATWAGTASGTANALTLTPSTAISAYAIGQSFIFKAGASANTSTTTISISGLSAITVQSNGAACAGGEILANNFYMGVLDTLTTFQITKMGEVTLAELGLSTTSSPEFAALNIGHASDTTLTRASAGKLAQAGVTLADLGANTFTGTQTWAKGADVVSATALDVGADGNYFDITGTTAITSIVTCGVGTVIKLHFDGALTFTHHSTDLILPGAANITTAAGDEAELVEYASGAWRCTSYTKASGTAVVSASAGVGDHEVVVTTGNGAGSTNTAVRRFTTTETDVGADITYADSAADGATFTINAAGIYAIDYLDAYTTGDPDAPFGISLNSNQLTTGIESITSTHRLAIANTITSSNIQSCSAVVSLAVNDIIRAHKRPGAGAMVTTVYKTKFRIRKIGAV